MAEALQDGYVHARIAEPFLPLYKPARNKVYYGGRGGRKSWEFAQALLAQGMQQKLLIICAREFLNSIDDSVHRLLSDTIFRLGLEGFYEVLHKTIRGKNGTEFVFKGIRNNIGNIKSFEGADRCWVEEAVDVSENSWDVLLPTIRKAGSEVWVSFNPNDELDNTYQRWVVNTPPDTVLIKVNYDDNPDLPQELRDQMELMRRTDYKKYLHIWEGEPNADYEDSIIQPEWFNASVGLHDRLGIDAKGVIASGFDPADDGQDDKAQAIRHGCVLQYIHAWSDGLVEDATEKAFVKARDMKAQHFVYDGIGIGTTVRSEMKHLLGDIQMQVEPFIASETPRDPDSKYEGRKNKDVFRNLRAQFWWLLRDRFEAAYKAAEGQYTDPDTIICIDPDIEGLATLRSELCRVQRKRGQNSWIQVESKDDMRKRQMPSPNRADALVMAYANKPPKVWRGTKRMPDLGRLA